MEHKLIVTPEELIKCQDYLYDFGITFGRNWRKGQYFYDCKALCIGDDLSLSCWTDLEDDYNEYYATEITPQQLLQMSLEDLKQGNIPEVNQYRIKTEQEFIDEIGEHWRSITAWTYGDDMDYLFGTAIDISKANKRNEQGWVVCNTMITDKPLPQETTGVPIQETPTHDFKVGDKVYIKCEIVFINENGTYCVDPLRTHSSIGSHVMEGKYLHKSIPKNINIDIPAKIDCSHHEINIKADQDTIENFKQNLHKEQKASVMWGDTDLSEEEKDCEILSNREREE